jgi:hypothetical protein
MATYGNHNQAGSRMYRVIRNTKAIPAQVQIVGTHAPIAFLPLAIGDIVIGRPTFFQTPFGTIMKVLFILQGVPYEIRDGFEDITPVKSSHEINKVPGTKTVFKKDTGIEGIGTKVEKSKAFGYIGLVLGAIYGITFAIRYNINEKNAPLYQSNKFLKGAMWAVIFAIVLHELGEQIDRYVMPAIKKQFA